MRLLVRYLHSFVVWVVIALATVLFGLPAIFAALVPPRGDWFIRFARGWARTLLFAAGVPVRVLHPERLRSGRSCVIVANHASGADILVLLSTLPMQVRFLAKRSIFRLPFLGWSIAAAGFVPVDRGESRRSLATVEAALRKLHGGRCVVVFPEETRTRTGELLPFKKGAALLALRSGLPLLPVGITGTFHILRRGSLLVTPGTVVLAVGEPIETTGKAGSSRADLTRVVRERIEQLIEEGQAESPESKV